MRGERSEIWVKLVDSVDLADDGAGSWVLEVGDCGGKLFVKPVGY